MAKEKRKKSTRKDNDTPHKLSLFLPRFARTVPEQDNRRQWRGSHRPPPPSALLPSWLAPRRLGRHTAFAGYAPTPPPARARSGAAAEPEGLVS